MSVMAEPRRVQLTSVTYDAPAPVGTDPPAPGPAEEGDPGGDPRPEQEVQSVRSVRLTLNLFQADDRDSPEFSYIQLLEDQVRQDEAEKLKENKAPLTPFEEEKHDNDELVKMAQKLEEKYGGKPKKKKDRVQDLIDMGFGYDDEDSFIDNSEAYDEFVPSSITTKFGGFYVNSGVLHFRDVTDLESDGTPTEGGTHSKKRKINGQMRPKNKRCKSGEFDDVQMSESGEEMRPPTMMMMKKKKKKKMAGTLSVTSMLKKFQREKERELQRNVKKAPDVGRTLLHLGPADAAGGGDPILSLLGSTDDQDLIKAASAVDFDIDLDTLLDVTESISSQTSASHPEKDGTEDRTQRLFEFQEDYRHKASSEEVQVLESNLPHKDVPLPEGLPPELEDSVEKLVMAAKTSEGGSKLKKFFTPDINTILLDVEFQCQQNVHLRSRVYAHLSSCLPCSRETLLKRVRKLLHKRAEAPPGVKDPVQRLRDAIACSMPDQIASFQESCQAFEQAKVLKVMEDKDDNVEQKTVKRGAPRKLFKWNEEIRDCLNGVIRAKMDVSKNETGGPQELEDALKVLIENEVQPLWPRGWMQSRILLRESRKVSELFASCQMKKSRLEKKNPSINDTLFTEGTAVRLSLPLDSPCEDPQVDAPVSRPAPPLAAPHRQETVPGKRDTSFDSEVPLAAEALAQGHHLPPTQEVLVAALAKYKHAAHPIKFSAELQSPPFPPPPPQSSPATVHESPGGSPAPPSGFPRQLSGKDIEIIEIFD